MKTIKIYVWKKAYNVSDTHYYTARWTVLYNYLSEIDSINKYFIRDKDIEKFNYSAAVNSWNDCKMLVFKVPRKQLSSFLLKWGYFKAYVDKYFIFKD